MFFEVNSDNIPSGNEPLSQSSVQVFVVGAKSSVGQTTFSGITLGGVGILKTFSVMFLIKFYLPTKVLGFIEPLEYLPFYYS